MKRTWLNKLLLLSSVTLFVLLSGPIHDANAYKARVKMVPHLKLGQNIFNPGLSSLPLLWSYITNFPVDSSPTIADINGDGIREVLSGAADYNLYCFNNDGSIRWKFQTSSYINSSAAVADIDGDGQMEIVFGSADYNFYCLNKDGQLLWKFGTGGYIWSSPAVADLNNDGKKEIVVGSYDGYLYCFDPKGNLLWKYKTNGLIEGSPAIADIDTTQNGLEIVIGSYDGNVYCLNKDGQLIWTYATGAGIKSSAAVADIDDNGTIEVLIGSDDKYLHCLDNKGHLVWKYQTGDIVESSPAVADINNDGVYDILFGSNDYYLYCLTNKGELTWKYQTQGFVHSSPAVGDYDGDGNLEIAIGSSSPHGAIYALDKDGHLLLSDDIGMIWTAPSIGDINGGGLEVLVDVWGPVGQVAAYTVAGTPKDNLPWPKFRHDLKNTGLYPKSNVPPPTGSCPYYVPRDYSTIQKAIDAAKDGCVIHVAAGTYNESLNFKGKKITVTADEGPQVTTIQSLTAGFAVIFTSGETKDSILEKFTITSPGKHGVLCQKSSPTVRNNIITGGVPASSGYGVEITEGNPTIDSNTITNYRTGIWIGYSASSYSSTISNNTISGNTYGGIYETGGGADNITHNLVINNVGAFGIGIMASAHPKIINNTIMGNKGSGIITYSSAEIKNNIISSNTIYGIYRYGTVNPVHTYNDIWNNTKGSFAGGISDGAGEIHLDPMLDSTYHPIFGSPAIDTGDPLLFDPDGTRSDIGNYFYDHSNSGGGDDKGDEHEIQE